jgi:hypothetical protein
VGTAQSLIRPCGRQFASAIKNDDPAESLSPRRREEAYQELNRQVFGGLVARPSDSITVSSLLGTPGTVATASLGHGCRSWVLAARAGMTGASTSQMAITPPPTRTASIATAASTPLTSAGRSRMGALPATSTPGPTA